MTGAAGGIGGAIAARLAERGYAVVAVDTREAALQTFVAGRLGGAPHSAVTADVGEPADWDRVVEAAQRAGDQVALLVQAAGVLLVGPLEQCDPEAIRRVVDVNLLGAALGARAVTPLLRAAARSSAAAPPLPRGVLNVASVFATVAPPGFAAYNASKAGVVALTESLYGELIADGLTATVVLPGVTPTGLFDSASYSEERLRAATIDTVRDAELTADAVAEAALRAYRRRRSVATIGARARRFTLLKAISPGRLRRRVAAAARRFLDGG